MADQKPKEARWDWTRHPLTSVIVGFVLTGVIGSLLTSFYAKREVERDAHTKNVEARREATEKLARFIYERRVMSEMLASALRRRAAIDEVKDRKRRYDEAYVSWSTNLQANLFSVREIVAERSYSDFEAHIEQQLVPVMRTADSCLTVAYDTRVENGDPIPVLDQCSMKQKIQLMLDCGYAITDELFKLADTGVSATGIEGENNRVEANKEVVRRCTHGPVAGG